MTTKEELLEGLELLYTGKAFAGFREDNPFVTFLGYDNIGWYGIWVRYGSRNIFTSIKDVVLQRDRRATVKLTN